MSTVFSNWRIFPLKEKVGSLLANGKFTLCETADVSFTIVDGPKGIFGALPSKKSGKKDDKTGKDIYYPDVKLIDEATSSAFQDEVKVQWNMKLSGAETAKPAATGKKVPF